MIDIFNNQKKKDTRDFWSIKQININNQELFRIIILFLIVLYIIFKKNLSLNLIISFILAFIISYFYLLYLNDNKVKKINKAKIDIKSLDIFEYKYLFLDVKIINSYSQLLLIRKYNLTAFNNSMNNMNKFLKIYYLLKKKYIKNNKKNMILEKTISQKINNGIININESVNSLLSMIINIPVNTKINDILYTEYIEEQTKILFNLANQKLDEIIKLYNLKYLEKNKINSYFNFIHSEGPQPNPLQSYGYMPNYNIY